MSELSFTIKIEDNSNIVLEAEHKAIEDALYAIGIKAVEGSVDAISGKYAIEPAVKTGRLRASISFITAGGREGAAKVPKPENSKTEDKLSGIAEKNCVIVGSNVEYAQQVHNGMWTSEKGGKNRKYKVRPFLREGIDKTKADMERQVNKIFKGEL